jgi:ABC-type transport system involved in multi-copper enzyme maturation permease subunit
MNGYWRAFVASLGHGLATFLRRRRTHMAFALVLLPALIPLILPVLPRDSHDPISRDWILTQMIEIFYISAVTPLLALFFAAMLVGEDVESQTISYILTRPVPRSAWVLGRFGAYLIVCSGLIFASIVALWLAVLPLPRPAAPDVDVLTLLQYQGAAMMSLLGYGALCAYLGSLVRHPIVVGVLLIFGWQRLAMLAPGVTDFLTIHKYAAALLPGGGRSDLSAIEGAASQLLRSEIAVQPVTALLTLLLFAAGCLTLAGLTVRRREYTTPVAVTE